MERGGPIATTMTPTTQVIPTRRRGARSLPILLVIYSADRGMIISGYQVSAVGLVRIPAEARWLR